jgi:hypothetical protein
MSEGFTNQGSILSKDLRAILNTERADAASEINCMQVGTIQSVNLAVGTVTVQLVLRRQVWNNPPSGGAPNAQPTVVPYPTLVDVPLYAPAGGTAFLTMPVAVGDTCIVLFNDRDLDPWWSTGSANAVPNDPSRVHSLADGVCLVGIRAKTNPIPTWNATKAQLRNGTSYLSVGPLIGVGNATTTLKLVLDMLAMVLTNWVDTHGDTPNPATLAAITAWMAMVNSLLE